MEENCIASAKVKSANLVLFVICQLKFNADTGFQSTHDMHSVVGQSLTLSRNICSGCLTGKCGSSLPWEQVI